MRKQAPSQANEVTVGFRVRRDQMPLIRRVAKHLRHKSVAAWVKTVFERELNQAMLEMVPEVKSDENQL